MIYCRRGWVRVVYEDQGEPFVMQAGDCVLQPPGIRHRVLEGSAGMEVVEIACPAQHETLADAQLTLPNERVDTQREFSGQKFVRHRAEQSTWQPWHTDGFMQRDLGLTLATRGLARACVVRAQRANAAIGPREQSETFFFLYVLAGQAMLSCQGEHRLASDTACVLPPATSYTLHGCSADFEFLQVALDLNLA